MNFCVHLIRRPNILIFDLHRCLSSPISSTVIFFAKYLSKFWKNRLVLIWQSPQSFLLFHFRRLVSSFLMLLIKFSSLSFCTIYSKESVRRFFLWLFDFFYVTFWLFNDFFYIFLYVTFWLLCNFFQSCTRFFCCTK